MLDRNERHYAALYQVLADIGAETPRDASDALADERRAAPAPSTSLTDAEAALIDYTLADAWPAIGRLARSYYRHRADDVDDAAAWLQSETMDYVVSGVVSGRCPVPATVGAWLVAAKVLRRRYWAERAIVVDGHPASLLADEDTNVRTRVRASRVQLDDVAFIGEMARLWCVGTGTADAPNWVLDTLCQLIEAADATYVEAADMLGITREGYKSRLARVKSGLRAGSVSALIG